MGMRMWSNFSDVSTDLGIVSRLHLPISDECSYRPQNSVSSSLTILPAAQISRKEEEIFNAQDIQLVTKGKRKTKKHLVVK